MKLLHSLMHAAVAVFAVVTGAVRAQPDPTASRRGFLVGAGSPDIVLPWLASVRLPRQTRPAQRATVELRIDAIVISMEHYCHLLPSGGVQ